MAEKRRVLVAGCGYVGSALAERLALAGHTVWGLRRQSADLPDGVIPLAADLSHPGSLQDLPPGLDVVAYTAAADRSDERAYRAGYVDGILHLIRALQAQAQQPKRLLFTSSTAVYGQADGEWVNEESPVQSADFRGRILLEAERLMLGGPFPGTVLRLGGIYGPGRTRVIDQVRTGNASCSPGPPVYSNRIHRDDCAGILHHLMTLADAQDVYIGVDREPADLCTIRRWVAGELGAPMPQVRAGTEPSRSNKRCSSERLVSSGFTFQYPTYREGLASLL